MNAQARLLDSVPPLVIRGESPRGEVLIDTLSFTVTRSALESTAALSVDAFSDPSPDDLESLALFVDSIFGVGTFRCEPLRGGRNFFRFSLPFEAKAGFITWGGNNLVQDFSGFERRVESRVQVYVTGEGCERIKDWSRVHKALHALDARLTRVDVAFDDHDGLYSVDHAREKFLAGEFAGQGRPPKAQFIDDFGNGKGRTLYVGSRENGKLFRCYEKGKQLGDQSSLWVRWEIQIGSQDREIPLAILLSPLPFLSGSYPALSFLSQITAVIRTCSEKLLISYTKLRRICRVQYGRLLNYAHRELGLDQASAFLEFVTFDGYPARLINAHHMRA